MACSGLVGMSPYNYSKESDLFMAQLAKQGVIDESVFSIFIDIQKNKSAMTFGGYDLNKYAQPNSTFNWHDAINGTYYWSLNL